MSSDVVLTSALRNNLLSLQNTQSLIDQTQLRLATGRKVNSALDSPQNFFAAETLNNRADDLNRLLDGIGQSITAIEQADTAIQSLTTLVEQADSIAQQARDAITTGGAQAKITGGVDLSGVTDLTSLTGIDDGDQLVLRTFDADGDPKNTTIEFATTIDNTLEVTSVDQLLTEINAIQDTDTKEQLFTARLTDDGLLEITQNTGKSFEIDFESTDNDFANDAALGNALGFGSFDIEAATDAGFAAGVSTSDEAQITVSASATLTSKTLYNQSTDKVATRTTTLANLTDEVTGSAGDIFAGGASDSFQVAVDGGTFVSVANGDGTLQDLIDGINTNASLNTKIAASFDETTGQLNIRAIDSSVQSIQFAAVDATADTGTAASLDLADLGYGINTLSATDNMAQGSVESIQLGSAAGDLASLESEYNNIRTQIDALVADSGYRGTNLLNGDDLTTFFNEDRSNSLTTEGTTLTSAGLGITEANFGSTTTIDSAVSQVREATLAIREFNSSIANDLAVLQTRQDFTTQTIQNLNTGADKLTIADQNEEGAKLLSLQTRQQLGVTSLSLASQSQQAVLRLF